jgi:disulfide bond formation protein DsbB
MHNHVSHSPPPRTLAVLFVLAAAAALAAAYGIETWGGMVPCALCLLERWPYRVIIVLGLAAAVAPHGLVRPLLVVAILCGLAGAAIAAVHVGVEWHWWPSPLPECAAPHFTSGSVADRLANMPAHPSKPCDEPIFLIPGLPLSIAALNMLFALALSGGVAIFLGRRRSYRR